MRSSLNSPNGDSTATRELAGLRHLSPRKRDRAAKQSALIQAATELFAARGFERTTTRAIAARAGCAEGLIHRYFNGKAGLLLAIIHSRVSQEVVDLSDKLPLPMKLEDEILQLVDWEMDRMWEDRDFLSVIIPRALLDPEVGQVLSKIGPPRHAKAIAERLKHFKQCRTLSDEEREAVALFIGVVGFVFGFMRPIILGQNRNEAKKTAVTLANIFVRGLHAQVLHGTSHSGQELARSGESMDRAKFRPTPKARGTELGQSIVIEGKSRDAADCREELGGAGRNRTDV